MQVTEEMIAAAQEATPRWMNATDSELRYIIEAALDAMPKATGGYVSGPAPLPRAGCMGDGYLMPQPRNIKLNPPITVPAGATITFLLATDSDGRGELTADMLRMDVRSQAVPPEDATPYRPTPITIPASHPLLDADGFEDLSALPGRHWTIGTAAEATQQSIPVVEPRPLTTEDQLHLYLGVQPEVVARLVIQRYDFPEPICETRGDKTHFGQPLYDPEAVKAWYDALSQAADG